MTKEVNVADYCFRTVPWITEMWEVRQRLFQSFTTRKYKMGCNWRRVVRTLVL